MITGRRGSVLYRVRCRHGRPKSILVLRKGGDATGAHGHVGQWTRLSGITGVPPAAAAIPGREDAGGRVPDAVGTRLRLITLGLLRPTSLARMRGARPVARTCRGLHCHSCPARYQLAVVDDEGSCFNPAACVGRACSPGQIMTCR
jgi:hypothetical protein